VRGPGDTQDTFREAPRCGGGAPEYIVPGGPDAAWAIGDIYCGSLTGDSGGAGRRLRLKFWTETVKPSARRADTERTTSSSRGLTAIILRLRWSSRRRLFGAAASFLGAYRETPECGFQFRGQGLAPNWACPNNGFWDSPLAGTVPARRRGQGLAPNGACPNNGFWDSPLAGTVPTGAAGAPPCRPRRRPSVR
jgi:hypothetical protein